MVDDSVQDAPDPRALDLARRVRQMRKDLGLTQAQLAIRAGIERMTVVNIERAHAEQPGVYNVDALAKAFGVTQEKLLYGRDPDLEERFNSWLDRMEHDATRAVNALAMILGWKRDRRDR